MAMSVRSKIIKIGNSKGIRIPRSLLEQAGLVDEVEINVEKDQLIIHPIHTPRQGWESQFEKMAKNGDDQLIIDMIPNDWDTHEWSW